MDAFSPVAVAVGILLFALGVGIAVIFARTRQAARLRDRFAEQSRQDANLLANHGVAAGAAGPAMVHMGSFHLGPITPDQREIFIAAWRDVQGRFAQDPGAAVSNADELLGKIMLARGYGLALMSNVNDLPVEQIEALRHYSVGHAIARSHLQGSADADQLRHAIVHFGALFDDLVNEPLDFSPVIENRFSRLHDLGGEPASRP